MASAADLSGRLMKFEVNSSPVEFEIISGSVNDAAVTTNYCPTGTNEIQRTVYHHRLVTLNVTAVLLSSNLPFTVLKPGTALTAFTVTLDRTQGTPDTHTSTDAVVVSMNHAFDTSTHQTFDCVITCDGNYTVPT